MILLIFFWFVQLAFAVNSNSLHSNRPLLNVNKASKRVGDWSKVGQWLLGWSPFDKSTHYTTTNAISHGPRTPELRKKAFYSRYANQLVIRFNTSTVLEADELVEVSRSLFLDVWDDSGSHVDIRLEKDDLPPLLGLLPPSLQHAHRPLMQGLDLMHAVADTFPLNEETQPLDIRRRRRTFTPDLGTSESSEFFREYRSLSVLVPWMRLLASLFPSNVRLITVGKSWEGREILALRVGVRASNSEEPTKPRKTIVVTGGSHAREWISTSTVSYIMYSVIIGYGRDSDITTLLEQLDFVFVPTLNPDGYAYSWERDRLWRKTRQPSPIPFCHGIDIDRSWSYQWDDSQSASPCSENYAGEAPFYSLEARSFAEWLRNETTTGKTSFIGMIDLHSYSQSILLPFSYSCDELPPNIEDLEELGHGMSRAIKRTYGEYFDVTSACRNNVLTSSGAGSSDSSRTQSVRGSPLDWFHRSMNVKYAYQIKLRDTGSYGFLVPPEYIVPSGHEIFNAVLFLAQSLTSTDSTPNVKKPVLRRPTASTTPNDL